VERRSTETTPEDPSIPGRAGWEGMHVWWLVNRAETGADQVVFVRSDFPSGKMHELHRHPNCEEVIYVLEGSGLHLGEGEPVRLEQGDAAYIGRGEWHGFHNDTGQVTSLIGVYGGVGSLEEAGYEAAD
jgi:quercetin dioxygenase-like cupin family protein